jgi:glycosyltransferase involved in cell wall biosynthesis
VPYKRLDIAIEACRQAKVPLRIVGRGPEEARLRQLAGADVEFLGWRSDEDIRDLYGRVTAVLLPGTEDFGMVPVEAQACGTPVVALRAGGACETATIRANAERFSRARFMTDFPAAIADALAAREASR